MSEHSDLLRDTVERLLHDHVTREILEGAEAGEWPAALWKELEENGLTQPLVKDLGGGTWEDAQVIVQAAARHSTPLPLAETLLGGWLLDQAGVEVPEGSLSVVPLSESLLLSADGQLEGEAKGVPWGAHVDHLVVAGGGRVALVSTGDAQSERGSNLALEPRDSLRFGAVRTVATGALPSELVDDPIEHYGALLRSVQMVGALEHLLDECVTFAGDRVQFGRPIGKFQAIQHMLAVSAGQTAAAGAAADMAVLSTQNGSQRAAFDIAIAKIRVGEAAGEVASIAHQVHGAIGFTYEHALHFATRRLWAWRAEYGAESQWAEQLGRRVAARGANSLWMDVTARA